MSNEYTGNAARLLSLGEIEAFGAWRDYLKLGLTADDVPDLLRMIDDESLYDLDLSGAEGWTPIHAWRALGQLRAAELGAIDAAYGAEAEAVARTHGAFLDMTPETYDAIKRRILDHWDDIQAIAAQVPPPAEIARLLEIAGGPTTADEFGLSPAEVALALNNGHYLRNRFTVRKLARVLGLDQERSL